MYEIARIKSVGELWSSFKTMLLELKTLYVSKLTESLMNSWKEKGSFPINKEVRKAVHERKKTPPLDVSDEW